MFGIPPDLRFSAARGARDHPRPVRGHRDALYRAILRGDIYPRSVVIGKSKYNIKIRLRNCNPHLLSYDYIDTNCIYLPTYARKFSVYVRTRT